MILLSALAENLKARKETMRAVKDLTTLTQQTKDRLDDPTLLELVPGLRDALEPQASR